MPDKDVLSQHEHQPLPYLGVDSQRQHLEADVAVDNKTFDNEVAGGVFGGDNGQNYRTMDRTSALMALLANQFGIGILSIPGTLKTLGLIPGLIVIIGMGPIAWYGGYLLYEFVCRYPHVSHVVDMVNIVGGRYWAAVAGFFFVVLVISTCASVVVTMSIALNTITGHSVCTVGFIGIACLACWFTCIPRTAKFVAHAGLPTCISIIAAILTVMISLGVSGPDLAPKDWTRQIELVRSPVSFREIFTACLRVMFAYAGHFGFVSFMPEMKDPAKDFPFALTGLFICSTVLYTTVGVVIYCLAAEYTVSPALGSASLLFAKVAYGLALTAILTGGLGAGHVGIKFVYIYTMDWLGTIDQVTANTWKQIAFFAINIALLIFTLLINSAGLWASITELLDIYNDPYASVQGAFDCGDNSMS
ncbi:hypothetical protein ACHAO9_011202 [Fusarium lateritium]